MRIKNWSKFQHFKDRRPIWIKLYREIMDDLEWHNLSGDAAKFLVSLWLLASETDGNLPDITTISFRCRLDTKKCEKLFSELTHYIDIDLISDVYTDDIPEKRREETETEKIYRKFDHLKISVEDYEKLSANYSQEQVDDVLDRIENYNKNKQYKNLYLTAKNWLKRDNAKTQQEEPFFNLPNGKNL